MRPSPLSMSPIQLLSVDCECRPILPLWHLFISDVLFIGIVGYCFDGFISHNFVQDTAYQWISAFCTLMVILPKVQSHHSKHIAFSIRKYIFTIIYSLLLYYSLIKGLTFEIFHHFQLTVVIHQWGTSHQLRNSAVGSVDSECCNYNLWSPVMIDFNSYESNCWLNWLTFSCLKS
jgi:hypothetical protein